MRRLPIFCLEEPDGAFYYGFPDLGAGCKVGRHHGDADLAAIRAFMERRLPQANGALKASDVCLYTNTPDFHFVVDRHPRHTEVILASVCSGHGFKFAAVMGEIIADLVQDKRPAFDLSMFRMARLA
jgi:glycine/D-amino acid oxidase-like deaminating enzyme